MHRSLRSFPGCLGDSLDGLSGSCNSSDEKQVQGRDGIDIDIREGGYIDESPDKGKGLRRNLSHRFGGLPIILLHLKVSFKGINPVLFVIRILFFLIEHPL